MVPASHSLMNSDILSKKDRQREKEREKRGVAKSTRYNRAKEGRRQSTTLLEGSQASPARPSGNNTK